MQCPEVRKGRHAGRVRGPVWLERVGSPLRCPWRQAEENLVGWGEESELSPE